MATDRLIVYRTVASEKQEQPWRWRRVAPNGRIVANGGEAYFNRSDCLESAQRINAKPFDLLIDDADAPEQMETDVSGGTVPEETAGP